MSLWDWSQIMYVVSPRFYVHCWSVSDFNSSDPNCTNDHYIYQNYQLPKLHLSGQSGQFLAKIFETFWSCEKMMMMSCPVALYCYCCKDTGTSFSWETWFMIVPVNQHRRVDFDRYLAFEFPLIFCFVFLCKNWQYYDSIALQKQCLIGV